MSGVVKSFFMRGGASMRKVSKFAAGIAVLFGIPFLVLRVYLDAAGAGCTTTRVAQVESPANDRMAVVNASWCQSLSVTTANYDVGLILLGDPPRSAVVLTKVDHGYDEDRPRIAWIASDLLQITVPNLSHPNLLTREYRGVRIDLRYDPDDPAARAAWRQSPGERPDPDEPQ
jgi:hypothetical protein